MRAPGLALGLTVAVGKAVVRRDRQHHGQAPCEQFGLEIFTIRAEQVSERAPVVILALLAKNQTDAIVVRADRLAQCIARVRCQCLRGLVVDCKFRCIDADQADFAAVPKSHGIAVVYMAHRRGVVDSCCRAGDAFSTGDTGRQRRQAQKKASADAFFQFVYDAEVDQDLPPNRLRNFSTWPAESSIFCLPV